MNEMLHQLENNEAVLLMYIAGELSEEERREVEQMLSVDAGLLRMYENLRGAWTTAMHAVEHLDETESLLGARRASASAHHASPDAASFKLANLSARDAAARQVGRMVRTWHAGQVARAGMKINPVPPRSTLRVPWWVGTLSAAAAVLIGYLAWWGYHDGDLPRTVVATTNESETSGPMAMGARPTGGLATTLGEWGRGAWNGGFGGGGFGGGGFGGGFGGGSRFINIDEPNETGGYRVYVFDVTGFANNELGRMDGDVRALEVVTEDPVEPVFVE